MNLVLILYRQFANAGVQGGCVSVCSTVRSKGELESNLSEALDVYE